MRVRFEIVPDLEVGMEFLMARVEVGNDEYTAMRDELLAWWRTAPEYVRRELVLMPRYDGKEAADGD